MNAIDTPVIVFQLALPIVLLCLLLTLPLKNRVGYGIQAFSTGMSILAIALVSIWIVPPWWTPALYIALWAIVVAAHTLRHDWALAPLHPENPNGWLAGVGYTGLGIFAAVVFSHALKGHELPVGTIELKQPLGPGTYLVANGGSTEAVNAHFLTLHPTTARQKAYHGQSFAVDLVKIDSLGFRASGWRPGSPTAYGIFGETVLAPCDGKVIAAVDDMPDMPVPEPDTTRLEGNHVYLACGDYGVLLAHLQSGTVAVNTGDSVSAGQSIGNVGNSGQTFEPHLHIHAQRLSTDGYYLSGKPLPITLDGIYPVRNMLLGVPSGELPD